MFSNEPKRRGTQVNNTEFNFIGFTVPFKSMQTLKFIPKATNEFFVTIKQMFGGSIAKQVGIK